MMFLFVSLTQYRRKQIPLKRFATVNEIYKCVDFIIKNDYFNGKCLRVDGGLEY